ncbi:hypothetical protein SLEP1_g51470 [Rubroshorea leprosula]|uniref:Sey1/RHD3-like three-helix bundle domain-containing protein n=1 Tax=Rubroshorea leprosula TaxID=152421 RepID=A0AAV5M5G9_9ROSI|nr:hypothetical protein SLEP1_g51470 [Rubroshorea leprosula]
MLNKGDGFAASVRTCTGSCMLEFDLGCADAAIKQANWDASKVREKFRHDIDGLVSSLCSAKLSELVGNYKKQLSQALMKPVETLLEAGGKDTWSSIRKLLEHETETAASEFSTAISGFELDRATINRMVQDLGNYARNVVEKIARQEAGKVLIRMKGSQPSLIMEKAQSQDFGQEKKTLRQLQRMPELRVSKALICYGRHTLG